MKEAKQRYAEKLANRHGFDKAFSMRILKMSSRLNAFRLREYMESTPIYCLMLREAQPEFYKKLIGY